MHAMIRRYRCEPGEVDELMHRIDADFLPLIEDADGFVDYQAIDTGDGTFVTISMFETAEGAEASSRTAADFVRRELADRGIERVDMFGGEVMVSRAAERMLEPTHH